MEGSRTNVLNKVFSRNTFSDILNSKESNNYIAAINKSIDFSVDKKNIDLIRELYNKIKNSYRNEYFYKNTLLNKLLLGVHSTNTTTALSEISIAKSKADLILINGKAIIYEIKTELDNLDRLEQQIHDYYTVFDHVTVVTWDCESNLSALKKILDRLEYPVGVHVLRRSGCIGKIRNPEPYIASLDFENMFKLLRKSEYEKLVLKFYKELPQVSQFKYYKECKQMLSLVDIALFYTEYLLVLKSRIKVKKDLFKMIPYELKYLAYFMNLQNEDYAKLNEFLNKPYGGVF